MKKITCIVVEDEPLAMERICRFIEKTARFEIVAKCISIRELEVELQKKSADMLFLDIQLAGDNSIDFARKNELKVPIVFTTAYDSYALESFELNVIDYLLKPFHYDRFEKSLEKIQSFLSQPELLVGSIIVPSEHTKIKLNYADILYVESMKDYVKIYSRGQLKPTLSRQNLKTFLAQLPAKNFIRVHRSFVVSLNEISKVTSHGVVLGSKEIPLGNLYKEDFLKVYFK